MSSRFVVTVLRLETRRQGDARRMSNLDARTRWLALYVLCLASLMIVLDVTIVNVALPSIRDDLGFSETSLAWVVNAYLLDVRRLPAPRRPARRPLRSPAAVPARASALFTVASLACGLATSQEFLIAARARAGRRRRGRIGGLALADDEALHRAGRAREGDGHLRLRRLRRRQPRRRARRDPHRHDQLALDLPRQLPDRRARRAALAAAAAGGARPRGRRSGSTSAAR